VAIAVLLLIHVPPGVVLPKLTVAPWHIVKVAAVIGKGEGFTVTTVVISPQSVLYVIFAVPADTPFTIPLAAPIDTTATLSLLQMPPLVRLASVIEVPAHIFVLPVIAGTIGSQ
jgi:hypothetical protein